DPSLFLPSVTLTLRKEGDALVKLDVAFTTESKRRIVLVELYYLLKSSPKRPLSLGAYWLIKHGYTERSNDYIQYKKS
ncbi:hypothetical protein, partial [Gracilimonas amylolytica]|uniref:hypothetical protein n=1 Tax=Gracilimonas amylolytica TaxID=1749045 RepID=UPI001E492651